MSKKTNDTDGAEDKDKPNLEKETKQPDSKANSDQKPSNLSEEDIAKLIKENEALKKTQSTEQKKRQELEDKVNQIAQGFNSALGIEQEADEIEPVDQINEVTKRIKELEHRNAVAEGRELINEVVEGLEVDKKWKGYIKRRALAGNLTPNQVQEFMQNELELLKENFGDDLKPRDNEQRPNQGGYSAAKPKFKANEILERLKARE